MPVYDSELFGANGRETGEKAKRWVDQDFKAVESFIKVPEDPGLGIELNEEIVNKYRVK